MKIVDINCDLGEEIGNDALLMPYITSANIACGFHAGTYEKMEETLLLAKKYGVHAGAHPSYYDRANFGRREMDLTPNKIFELITAQLNILSPIARKHDILLHHVKPHGALYNTAAKDPDVARAIAMAVKAFDPSLYLYGLSGSFLIREGKKMGLQTKSETFADRTYQDDGSLTPRSMPGALITDTNKVIAQVLQLINSNSVTTMSGKTIPVVAETICIHGDGEHAVDFAKAIFNALQKENDSAS